MQNDIGVIEAEAIERGEAPQWVAVARRMDEMSARMRALAEPSSGWSGRCGPEPRERRHRLGPASAGAWSVRLSPIGPLGAPLSLRIWLRRARSGLEPLRDGSHLLTARTRAGTDSIRHCSSLNLLSFPRILKHLTFS